MAALPELGRRVVEAHANGTPIAKLVTTLGVSARAIARERRAALTHLRLALAPRGPGGNVAAPPFTTTPQPFSHRDHEEFMSTRVPTPDPPSPTGAARRRVPPARPASTPNVAADVDTAVALASMPLGEPRFVPMTPGLALALLERNRKNRPLVEERIRAYARDMVDGVWRQNNQGIALGENGDLYDGQHRLHAVARSNRTVPMLVVAGLPPEARATIDQGRSRSVGDALGMLDDELHGKEFAAWVRTIERLHRRDDRVLSANAARVEIAKYRTAMERMLTLGPRSRRLGRADIVGALVYAMHTVGDRLDGFVRGYLSGADLHDRSPALLLRNYVLEHMGGHGEKRTASLKALRCALADLRGEQPDQIHAGEEAYRYFRRLDPAVNATAA